jgi:hypothetical protein
MPARGDRRPRRVKSDNRAIQGPDGAPDDQVGRDALHGRADAAPVLRVRPALHPVPSPKACAPEFGRPGQHGAILIRMRDVGPAFQAFLRGFHVTVYREHDASKRPLAALPLVFPS